MKESNNKYFPPWMPEFKKDAKSFIPFGIFCGILQIISFKFFDKSQFGADLALNRIAFNSMLTLLLVSLALELTSYFSSKYTTRKALSSMTDSYWGKTSSIANVAGFTVLGFGIVILMSRDYRGAYVAYIFSLYCIGIGMIAANFKLHGFTAWKLQSTQIALFFIASSLLLN